MNNLFNNMPIIDESCIDETLIDFFQYYKIIVMHGVQSQNYFRLWENFMTNAIVYSKVSSQCSTFIRLTQLSFLESAFMGLARLYDDFDYKKWRFSLRCLADEVEKYGEILPVKTVSYRWTNISILSYIKKKWVKKHPGCIKLETDTSIVLELSCVDCAEFIRSVASSMKNRYADFFDLRNKYFAHNDYGFGLGLLTEIKLIKETILVQYEELLNICFDCLNVVGLMFYEDRVVGVMSRLPINLDDVRFLFSSAEQYFQSLSLLETSQKECIYCHKFYKQEIYKQDAGYKTLCDDICPYCFNKNGKPKDKWFVNLKDENMIDVLRENHLLNEKKNS